MAQHAPPGIEHGQLEFVSPGRDCVPEPLDRTQLTIPVADLSGENASLLEQVDQGLGDVLAPRPEVDGAAQHPEPSVVVAGHPHRLRGPQRPAERAVLLTGEGVMVGD